MAGRDGQGKSFAPGSRKRDTTVDDALQTMERLALWLENANKENVWLQTEDPVQMAMLHGMLVHLRAEIDHLISLGGNELDETVKALHTLAAQNKDTEIR